MKKAKLLEKLDKSWADFNDSFSGLTEAQMMEPGVTGDWSVKDILAHVICWEEEALKYLPLVLLGERPPRYSLLYGGIDAFNTIMTEKFRSLPLADVINQLDQTHQRLVEYVRTISDEYFISETRFRHRLRLDTYSHYPIHTRAICEWRKKYIA